MKASALWYGIPAITNSGKLEAIIKYRNQLIINSNWTQNIDTPLTTTDKLAWQTYREDLQVIEFTNSDPELIIFPDPPIFINAPVSQETLDYRTNRAELRRNAITTITQLQSIEDAVNPTNAQVIAAIKFLAKTLRLLLRLLVRII